MNNKTNRYQEPECSVVEFEVDGTILTISTLSQDGVKLDTYDELKDVEW